MANETWYKLEITEENQHLEQIVLDGLKAVFMSSLGKKIPPVDFYAKRRNKISEPFYPFTLYATPMAAQYCKDLLDAYFTPCDRPDLTGFEGMFGTAPIESLT